MSQVFGPSANTISKISLVILVFLVAGGLCALDIIHRSPYVRYTGEPRSQDVPFSHKHHTSLGIDCRYCHTSVEESQIANIPPTRICMNCHNLIWSDSEMLEPVRESWRTGEALEWSRVHDLPDFVYFDHSIHVNRGIACVTCHGRVDQMPLVWREKPLFMKWCLECHRSPEKFIRPKEEVVNMAWDWPKGSSQEENGPKLVEEIGIDRIQPQDDGLLDLPPMKDSLSPINHTSPPPPADLTEARKRLEAVHDRAFWRNLEELASADSGGRMVQRKFPQLAPNEDEVDRREFMKLMGASVALAGMTACTRQPIEKIVPYVNPPEEGIPGKPLFFATAFSLGGYAHGVLAESHMGRPTKIEGNPLHPASLGSTDVFAQASVLNLYDIDRSQAVRFLGRPSGWSSFVDTLETQLGDVGTRDGAGLRILTGNMTSPTFSAQQKKLNAKFPKATWHQYEPLHRDHVLEGSQKAFGRIVDTLYDFTKADVVVSLDADFLLNSPAFARHARDFALRRNPGDRFEQMNRLYVAESSPTVSGTAADHRLPVRFSEIERVARAVAAGLGIAVEHQELTDDQETFVRAIIDDVQAHPRAAVVVAGDEQPPIVHALAHAINQKLGAVNTTVRYVDPAAIDPVNNVESLRELVEAMNAGEVELLILADVNPVFTAPANLDFMAALDKVKTRIHYGLYFDETARLCHWHIPATHYLEGWSDARAFDGTASIVQPLIQPLYEGRTIHEFLAAMTGEGGKPAYDIVRDAWKESGLGDERKWRRALHDGVIAGTESKTVSVQNRDDFKEEASPLSGIEVVFRRDPSVYDGRFANNGWLQELPRPITKLTWDNAALMSTALASRLKVGNHLDDADQVTIQSGDVSLTLPVLVVPGHASDSVTIHLGYGRKYEGHVYGDTQAPIGVDVYPLRRSNGMSVLTGATIKRAPGSRSLATTQHHPTMQQTGAVKNRHPIRVGTVEEYARHPEHPPFVHTVHEPAKEDTLYEGYDYSKGNQWGMVVNLNTCIGCNACTIACQAENNIPIVGKEEVLKGREMHWIRLDRYYEGEEDNPSTYHQPVACMHCETAPCETVCPVGATVHSAEGLNQMVYNRCVGTRYCSNNCPYKVRRFNFFKYVDHDTEVSKFQRNPNVTVRSRGVMEKCSYCVQRINVARIEAKKDGNRPIREGEVLTACQQACPTKAITFGNLNDPESAVAKERKSPLNYGLLSELNTLPRTMYQAKLTNPNPLLSKTPGHADEGPQTGSQHG